ncbi:MAG: SoxR reducing system RseC family protein [Tissierellia bacterium]|nr:SoxR reducing system RseC family protein [Tissierellia bacterium]
MQDIVKKGIVAQSENGEVRIMVLRDSACGTCSTCGGCETKPTFIKLKNYGDLKPGDEVYLRTKGSEVLKISSIVYALPVVLMIIGAVIANVLFKNTSYDLNLMTLLFILIFLLVSIFIIKMIDKKYKSNRNIEVTKA